MGHLAEQVDVPIADSPLIAMNREEFVQALREALNHLYDPVHLQLHPLNRTLIPPGQGPRDVDSLHRILLENIERLRPDPGVPTTDPAWRPYFALYYRYVEGLDVHQTAEELALSERQLRREHARGLEALADLLWEQRQRGNVPVQTQVAPQTSPGIEEELLATELTRFGLATINNVQTSVHETLEGVLETLSDLARRQSIGLHVVWPQTLPPVSCDRVVLRQILFNLLTEILSRGTQGRIHVQGQADERHVSLVLEYTGPPLQSPSAEDDRVEVAQRLLRLQGGQLQVNETATTMQLTLPLYRPTTVLVVDDNPDIGQLFKRYLAGGAYCTLTATNSQDALALAINSLPHVIVLDVMMPGQDGWELLQRLKNHPQTHSIPIIVCSVLHEKPLALSLGATAFLTKPVTQQVLLQAVGQCVSTSAHATHRDLS